MKIVVDTNDFISALIGKRHREKLRIILDRSDVDLFADENLLTELAGVAGREKFRQYVTPADAALFLEAIRARLIVVSPTTVVTDSADPDDTYLLSLAIDAQADYLITGDKKHLLAINSYRGILIIHLQTLLDLLSKS